MTPLLETKEKTIQSEILLQFQRLKQGVTLSSMLKLATLTSLGVMGRVALQWIPSVEPIVPLAIVVSFFLGYKYGVPTGMGAFYMSNFLVWGGQGPWTIFQVIGTGVAGLTGGMFGRLSKSKYSLLAAAFIGTLFYELIVDMSFLIFGLFSPLLLFIMPLPFTVTHITSSVGFSMILYGFKDKISDILHEIYELRIHSIRHIASAGSNLHGRKLGRIVRTITVRRWRPGKGDDFNRDRD